MKLMRILLLVMLGWGVMPTQAQDLSVTYRFLNLTSSDSLDLYRNESNALLGNLREVFSAERVIESGQQTFQVFPANGTEPLAELTLELEPNTNFLLLAIQEGETIVLRRYDYDVSPIPTNRARFEIVHLSQVVPALSVVGQNLDVLFEVVSPGEITIGEIPGGTYQLSYRDAASGEDLFARSLNAVQGAMVTVFIYDKGESFGYFEVPRILDTLAYFRMTNASLAASAVDIYLDGELTFENLPYLESTPYTALPSGDYNIAIYEVGATPEDSFALWEGLTTISKTAPLTAVIFGENLMRVSINQDDHQQIPLERARLRFVNVAVNLPSLVVKDSANTVILESLEYALGSRNLLVTTGSQNLMFGSTLGDTYNTLENFNIEANHSYTIIVTGNPGESGEVELMILDWNWKQEVSE